MMGLKGSYTLVLRLAAAKRIQIGKLGEFYFPAGYCLYFGSALNGLAGRVGRHLRPSKTLHWHIDYLTAEVPVFQVWGTTDSKRWECQWAQAALLTPGISLPAPGFGSSDCRCAAHLVYASDAEMVATALSRLNPPPKRWGQSGPL